MIKLDYEEEKAVLLSQGFVGEDVSVEILDEFGDVDYDFRIPQEDFIKFLNEYQKSKNII